MRYIVLCDASSHGGLLDASYLPTPQATASVDFATDALIQRSLRSELQGITLITIGASLRAVHAAVINF